MLKSWKQYLESAGTLRAGSWIDLDGVGYTLQVSQYSNKGPMIVVNGPDGGELGRARFNLFNNQWTTDAKSDGYQL